MAPRYYQSSNKMPLGGVFLTLLGGLATALGLGIVYPNLTWFISRPYVDFVLVVLLGAAIGWVVHRLARVGHLRSVAGVTTLGAIVGLVAVYVQWAAYLTLLSNATGSGKDVTSSFDLATFLGLLTHPAAMWELVHLLNAEGAWSLLGLTPSGFFLWLLWLAEAGIVLLASAFLGTESIEQPYSETARAWATATTLPTLLTPQPDLEATRTALEAGHFDEVLHPSPAAPDELGEFWQLRLHQVPQDETCRYLSLDQFTRKVDKKGKPETDHKPLVERLALTPAQYNALAARFGAGTEKK